MEFLNHDSGRRIRDLVKKEECTEAALLASEDAHLALELVKLLEDPDSEIRENAAWAIANIGKDELEVPKALKEVVPELTDLLNSSKIEVRKAAALALRDMAGNSLGRGYLELMALPLPRLIELLKDPEVEVRKNAISAIRWIVEWIEDNKRDFRLIMPVIPNLPKLLKDHAEVRIEAVQVLRPLVGSEPEATKITVDGVIETLRSSYASISDMARLWPCITVREMAGQYPELLSPAIPFLTELLKDDWNIIRCNAAIALVSITEEHSALKKTALAQLVQLLEDPNISAHYLTLIIRVLDRIGEKQPDLVRPTVPILTKLLEHSNEDIRKSADQALKSLGKATDNVTEPKIESKFAPSNMTNDIRCPICGSETTIRTAKQGPNVGSQFHVCARYPECKGKVSID